MFCCVHFFILTFDLVPNFDIVLRTVGTNGGSDHTAAQCMHVYITYCTIKALVLGWKFDIFLFWVVVPLVEKAHFATCPRQLKVSFVTNKIITKYMLNCLAKWAFSTSASDHVKRWWLHCGKLHALGGKIHNLPT